MNIVFMGTPDFATPSLEQLNKSNHVIKAVVTGIDKRRGRGNKLSPTPVKAKAQALGLPVIEVEDLTSAFFANQLKQLEVDLFAVVAFRILPPAVLEIPLKGSVNLHASLLPKYRGAAPIHWAIINGERRTGCTVFMLDETVDTGKIVMQSTTEIGDNETTGDLYNRLKIQGADLLVGAIDQIETGHFSPITQDEPKATPAPKLFTEDCKIDFHQSARDVHNRIRGLSPFPAAWVKLDNLKLTMYRSKIADEDALEPGQIIHKKGNMIAGCGTGSVVLEEVKIEGKKKMNGNDFMNGYHGICVLS